MINIQLKQKPALEMKTVRFSKTLVSTNESTWCQNPEEQRHHPHHHVNLKPQKSLGIHNDMKIRQRRTSLKIRI
jgi:hypothetical protein